MTTRVRSPQELYNLYRNEAQASRPDLTDWSEGSANDHMAGVSAFAVSEAVKLILSRFRATFFDLAEGEDLDFLAVDHFGEAFARPQAQQATGVLEFTRPDDSFGDVTIPAGTICRTPTDPLGNSIEFETSISVVMTGTSILVSAEALETGTQGNVEADSITIIDSALPDSSIEVNNPSAFAGGAETQNDAEYRETIRSLILSLPGATLTAIRAAALSVPGVEIAEAIEEIITAIRLNEAGETVGSSFELAKPTVFIADADGQASPQLIAQVLAAIEPVRAAGVLVTVEGAVPVFINWTAEITLNPSGPNFAELQVDPSPILTTMNNYLLNLPTGQDFIRADGNAAIMAAWGPSGSNDLTDFVTTVPVGDVSIEVGEKVIPGDLSIE